MKDSVTYSSSSNGVWQNILLNEITYDQNCNVKTIAGKTWDTSTNSWGEISFLTKNQYDDKDRIVDYTYQNFDFNTDQWVNVRRRKYSYDNNGLQKTTIYQDWDTLATAWKNVMKTNESFDDSGNVLSYVFSSYTNNTWLRRSRDLFSYDSLNRVTKKLHQQWENNKWITSIKTNSSYPEDMKKKSIEYTISSDNQWEKSGLSIDVHTKAWDKYFNGTDWIYSYRYFYEYDDNGQRTDVLAQHWDIYTQQWVNVVKTKSSHYPDGSIFILQEDWWDETANDWSPLLTVYTHNACYATAPIQYAGSAYDSLGQQQVYYNDNSTNGKITAFDLPWVNSCLKIAGKHRPGLSIGIERNQHGVNRKHAINEVGKNDDINIGIFPNPAKNYFTLQVKPEMINGQLVVITPEGKTVMQKIIKEKIFQRVDLPEIAKGVYFISVIAGNKIYTSKLVVQ